MKTRPDKSDRALELREKGLTPVQIAERLGSKPGVISTMIIHAKARRAKEAAALRPTVVEMEGQ